MNPEEMLSVLKSLQEELETAESIHPDHRKSLQSLTDEIQQTLKSGETSQSNGGPVAAGTLSQRMKQSLIEFEVRHPIIGGLVERIADGLAAMGI